MNFSIVNPNPPEPQALTVEAMARIWRDLSEATARAPQPIAWVMHMRPGTYRALWNTLSPMRRKIARMAHSPMRPTPR